MFSHRGVYNLHIAVNNKQPLSVVTQTPEWGFGTIIEQQNTSFSLNNTNVLKSLCKVPYFNQIRSISTDFRRSSHNQI
jgi:hypothetical protein